MQLFDDFQRTYEGFKEPRESNYAFLNRSARPEYERTRHVLEQWFLGYPEQHRHALKASFRSSTENTHLGAFLLGWQAYLDGRGILREEERQI